MKTNKKQEPKEEHSHQVKLQIREILFDVYKLTSTTQKPKKPSLKKITKTENGSERINIKDMINISSPLREIVPKEMLRDTTWAQEAFSPFEVRW